MSGGGWKLNKPIGDVCNPKVADKPMLCASPIYAPLLRQATFSGDAPIDATIKQTLLTALCAGRDKSPSQAKHPALAPHLDVLIGSDTRVIGAGTETIRHFNGRDYDGQQIFIDSIWKRLVDFRIPDTLGSAMTEHNGAADAKLTPLPTSIAPTNKDLEQFVPVRRDQGAAWKTHGIGFRVEGGKGADKDDMPRITSQGPRPLLNNRALLRTVRGWVADGTYIEKSDRVFLWWGNEDVLNESATCVARSLFGCTALPGRDTDTAKINLDFHYLLAISCKGRTGCDTEAWQQARGAGSVWRPGEKAFLGVDATHVIAWTKLVKKPGPAEGGWCFMLPETKWNWINDPGTDRTAYLNAEIGAYKAGQWYKVSGDYDFAK